MRGSPRQSSVGSGGGGGLDEPRVPTWSNSPVLTDAFSVMRARALARAISRVDGGRVAHGEASAANGWGDRSIGCFDMCQGDPQSPRALAIKHSCARG